MIPVTPLSPGPALPDAQAPQDGAAAMKAAKQFEAVLMQQLISVMRNTAKSGGMMSGSGASGQYLSMMDQALADQLAEGGGIGLAPIFASAIESRMGGQQTVSSGLGVTGTRSTAGSATTDEQAISPPPSSLSGATNRLARAAYGLAAREGGKQWAREGTLTPADLSSNVATPAEGGDAHFSVRDAQGFKDAYKCNLFALEAARRAGFQVPLVARAQGWGFPTSNTVTEDAADGSLKDHWADVVSPQQAEQLSSMLDRGEAAVLLSGNGDDGRHGHMAVVEKIHDVKIGKDGRIERIEFDGYEARVDGAEHLTRRTWNRYGHGQDEQRARNGFGRIEILALRPAADQKAPEITGQFKARASRLDSVSSSPSQRPIR